MNVVVSLMIFSIDFCKWIIIVFGVLFFVDLDYYVRVLDEWMRNI